MSTTDLRLHSPEEVEQLTGIKAATLRRLARTDQAPHVRLERNRIAFTAADVRTLIASRHRAPVPAPRALAAVPEAPAEESPFRPTPRSRTAHRSRKTA